MKGVGCLGVIIPVNALEFINNEVPRQYRARISPLIFDAYALAEQATQDADFLNWVLGHKNKGYLRRIAIDYMFKTAIDDGKLPFDYKVSSNINKSSWYLEIITENDIITTSQVQSSKDIARPAFYRKKLQDANQLILPLGSNEDDLMEGPYHLLITHGYGTEVPNFINLGFPNHNGWVDRINLLSEPAMIDNTHNEDIDTKERLVHFKDFTKEVSDNDS